MMFVSLTAGMVHQLDAAHLPRRTLLTNLAAASFATSASPGRISAAEADPEAVQRLYELCRSRRPSEWRPEERPAVDALVEEVSALQAAWDRDALPGTWRLAYLQPGPGGAGVDRRIPFPEFPWNDSYQQFGLQSVVNIGELLGPALSVRVSGGLREDDTTDLTAPKRFKADITSGALCLGAAGEYCAPLPIQGEGIFDGLYVGKNLRIGQNLNGGGARIVQVRVY